MAASTGSHLSRDLTKPHFLPDSSNASDQRWKSLPTRPRTETAPLNLSQSSSSRAQSCKTPNYSRRSKSAHTPGVTPGGKTPRTPGTAPVTPSSSVSSCRFIPKRTGLGDEYGSYVLLNRRPNQENEKDEEEEGEDKQGRDVYQNALMAASCKGSVPRSVLSFSNTPSAECHHVPQYVTSGGLGSNASITRSLTRRFGGLNIEEDACRKVDTSTERVLDAPDIVNDYYINVLDWSQRNVVAIALCEKIYLWDGETQQVEQLKDVGYDGVVVTSLSWADKGRFLAIGLDNGRIQLYDADIKKKIRTMRGHSDRVSCLHWSRHLLASGSRSGEIHIHDVRQPEHLLCRLLHHKMEVCGLQWSPNGSMLASGANDNLVCLWNPLVDERPVHILREHTAAVKAIAWCPWRPTLVATGGGSKDKSIKFWDCMTGQCLQTKPAKSPVTGIAWASNHKELITSHGYPKHQMTIWKLEPEMTKIAELEGHTGRILHMSLSPKGTHVISASADETLRIWHCFKKTPSPEVKEDEMSRLLRMGAM